VFSFSRPFKDWPPDLTLVQQCLAWNPACRRFGMWQSCFPDMEPYFLTLACRRFGTWRAGVTAIIQKLACSGRHVVGC
jgi:hypothetical protein